MFTSSTDDWQIMDENKPKALAAELAKVLKTEADLNQFHAC